MYNFFKWLLNLLDLAKSPERICGGVPRNSQWPKVRAHFLESHSVCACCGTNKNLNVHYKIPYHVDPTKELDESNLITLCEDHECHLMVGHLFNFSSYNVDVEKDAQIWYNKIKSRPQ